MAFNAPSLARFGPTVVPGGTIVYDSSVIADVPRIAAGVKAFGVPMTRIASELGRLVVKNVVALSLIHISDATRPY